MTSRQLGRLLYIAIIALSAILGFILSNVSAENWVPYVLLGLLSLSLGLLLTLLFVKRAGTTTSWPALVAMGIVFTLMFTGLFQRLPSEDVSVPDDVAAMVARIDRYHDDEQRYPVSLADLPDADVPSGVSYRSEDKGYRVTYRVSGGTLLVYDSERGHWQEVVE